MDDTSEDQIIQNFMDQWELLLDRLEDYKDLTEMQLPIKDLLLQNPSITQSNYEDLYTFIDTVYTIAEGATDVQDLAINKINRFAQLPSIEIDKVVMWVSDIENDDEFGPILELKKQLDVNELAQEIIRWGKENREGKDELNESGIH